METDLKEIYRDLVEKLEEITRLGGVMSTLHWDQEVMMPPGAAAARAKQMAALAGVLHEKSTDPKLGECLDRLVQALQENHSAFDVSQACNIREAKRDYDIEIRVPADLVKEMAELGSRGHQIWAKARKENRFADFAPVLKRFVELKTLWAHHVYPDKAPYDANIDLFERGTTMAQITPIFERLKGELVPLIRDIRENGRSPDDSFLKGEFPIGKQEALGRKISRDMGFCFDEGRMDVSVHPFCGGGHPTDVRITTRYRTDNFIESLYAVIHETGHGLYEQGRMQEGRDLPVSETLTMGIHESQSLFWERMIAQGKPFCVHYLDTFRATFPANFNGVTADALYRAVNACQPSFIRVEADEVTYPLHIILRYEIERDLFDGSVSVGELPELWNDKMVQYLGIRPPTDTLGVLQDVHWSGGAFGYFPSYTLGAMYACQFYRAMVRDIPETGQWIEQGNFTPIRAWLNEKIHRQGRLFTPGELVRKVTGEPLNPDHFINSLKNKYRGIYQL
ncbi:MAG: carboxypeptidase M32 [Nitrospinaceae bacterium]